MNKTQPLYLYYTISIFIPCVLLSGCADRINPAPVEYRSGEDGKNDDYASDMNFGQHHQVIAGETLCSIAKQYMVSISKIMQANGLRDYGIRVGQWLLIPQNNGINNAVMGEKVEVVSTTPIIKMQNDAQDFGSNKLQVPERKKPGWAVAGPKDARNISSRELEKKFAIQLERVKNGKKEPHKNNIPNTATISDEISSMTKRSGQFIWPLKGKIIVKFRAPLGTGKNDGINIIGKIGSPVRASQSGVVLFANDQLKEYGNLILIKHSGELMTVYAHLSKILVKKDRKVARGEVIGLLGKSGNVKIPQLHFEVRENKKPVDPNKFVK